LTDDIPKGIPGVKPARPEDLPPEERFQISNPELYGEFTDEDRQVARQQMEAVTGTAQIFDEDNALDWFQKKTVEGFRYWAGFTQYTVRFDDGSKQIYERQPLTKWQSNELLDLSAEIQGMATIDFEEKDGKIISGKRLSVIEVRRRQDLHDILKAKYYFKNVKTGKMMTKEELYHVADSTIIDSQLEACYAITVAKWAEGKK
jgi:hypothetical protein